MIYWEIETGCNIPQLMSIDMSVVKNRNSFILMKKSLEILAKVATDLNLNMGERSGVIFGRLKYIEARL